jgi:hypothetical protein
MQYLFLLLLHLDNNLLYRLFLLLDIYNYLINQLLIHLHHMDRLFQHSLVFVGLLLFM